MNQVHSLIQNHRSIRSFKKQPINESLLQQIVSCGQAASSSHFLQCYSLIRVTDAVIREEMYAVTGGQKHVLHAPECIVVCADIRRVLMCTKIHDISAETGYVEQLLTATIDASLVAQNMTIAAEASGLGVCYIGAIRNNPSKIIQHLQLPDQVFPLFALCLGYPDGAVPEVKQRLPQDMVWMRNVYGCLHETESLRRYDKSSSHYYATRSQNPKNQTWSEKSGMVLQSDHRSWLMADLQKQGFNTK